MMYIHSSVLDTYGAAWGTCNATGNTAIILPHDVIPYISTDNILPPILISRNPTLLRRTTFGHVSKHLNVY